MALRPRAKPFSGRGIGSMNAEDDIMAQSTGGRGLRALVLALCLATGGGGPSPVPLLAGLLAMAWPHAAEARSRSSGGYSLPAPRTPSVGRGDYGGGGFRTPSPSDSILSGRSSRDALEAYGRRRAPTPERTPDPYGGWPGRTSTYDPVPYGMSGTLPRRRSFGVWDALFLWYLLDTIDRPGHAAFFHNHRDDPGTADWRNEAEARAATDPDIRTKLDALDRELARNEGSPRDPDYLPPDVDPAAALAGDGPAVSRRLTPSGGDGGLGPLVVVIVAGLAFAMLARARRRRSASPGGGATEPSGGPSPFRVGMVLDLDPSPFLVGGARLKVPPPPQEAGRIAASASAIGRLAGGITLHRAYLDDSRFVEAHLDETGRPDEARYFAELDRVMPQSAEQWGFWLDPAEGQIGWSRFQTKDGALYERVWGGGDGPVPPQDFVETMQAIDGTRTVRHRMMLYARETGIAPPGPGIEYVLIDARDDGAAAAVTVHVGIDINPASLALA